MTDEQFRLTPLDVRRWEFGTAIRGYDRARVDEFKARVADELEELTRRINDLDGKARGFHEQLRAFRERDKALNDALVSAQQLRGEIREQAEKESQLLVQEARTGAERALNEATLEAGRLVQAARAEADRTLLEARREADSIALGAQTRAEQRVREAQAEAERLVRTARDEARALAEAGQAEHQRLSFELEQLQRMRQSTLGQLKALADRVLADVDAARSVAATVPSPGVPSARQETAPREGPAAAPARPDAGTAARREPVAAAPATPALVSPAAAPSAPEPDPDAIVDARLRERKTPPVNRAHRHAPRDPRSPS